MLTADYMKKFFAAIMSAAISVPAIAGGFYLLYLLVIELGT